jgi:hypothetical protein
VSKLDFHVYYNPDRRGFVGCCTQYPDVVCVADDVTAALHAIMGRVRAVVGEDARLSLYRIHASGRIEK